MDTPFLFQVVYMGSLIGLTVWKRDYEKENSSPDKMVAYFSIIHVGIWIVVGIFDR